MLNNGSASSARPRPRPPRREFITTICTEDLGRYSGVGLTLDHVIEEELRNVVATLAATPLGEADELVIWEGNKVAALIRIGPDHRPVVTRFDSPAGSSLAGLDRSIETAGCAEVMTGVSPIALAARETRSAIAHFQAMRQAAAAADAQLQEAIGNGILAGPGEPARVHWENWARLCREATILAGRHLVHCILALNGQLEHLSSVGEPGSHWTHCGVRLDDRLYLALGCETGAIPVVVEISHVVRLDSSRTSGSP